MFCIGCGATLKDGALFCTSCGARVPGAAEAPVAGPVDVAEQDTVILRAVPAQQLRDVPSPDAQAGPRRGRAGLFVALAVAGVLVLGGVGAYVAYSRGMFDKVEKSVAAPDTASAGEPSATDGSTRASGSPAGNNSEAESQTQPTGSPTDITSLARVSVSTRRKGYPAANLTDAKFNTVWAEGRMRKGDYGEGESVTFTFPQDVWVSQVRVVPGYVKFDSKNSVDRWYSNGRVRSGKLVFSDGTESQETQFDTDAKVWQNLMLPTAKKTTRVKFVIVSTDPANTGTHHDDSDTSIAEMRIMGYRP